MNSVRTKSKLIIIEIAEDHVLLGFLMVEELSLVEGGLSRRAFSFLATGVGDDGFGETAASLVVPVQAACFTCVDSLDETPAVRGTGR